MKSRSQSNWIDGIGILKARRFCGRSIVCTLHSRKPLYCTSRWSILKINLMPQAHLVSWYHRYCTRTSRTIEHNQQSIIAVHLNDKWNRAQTRLPTTKFLHPCLAVKLLVEADIVSPTNEDQNSKYKVRNNTLIHVNVTSSTAKNRFYKPSGNGYE